MNRTRAWIASILSSSSFLATDLITVLSDFEIHTHFHQASEHVMIAENTGIPVVNQDLSLWARSIFGFTQLLRQLEDYGLKYLPMMYEDRPDLTPPESDTAAETPNS